MVALRPSHQWRVHPWVVDVGLRRIHLGADKTAREVRVDADREPVWGSELDEVADEASHHRRVLHPTASR